ncbi:hypothetical protein ACVGWW_00585, partial [Enterobacter hormaechei]
FLRRCRRWCTVGGIENNFQFSSIGFIANRLFDLFKDARLRSRVFHRRFVAIYRVNRCLFYTTAAGDDGAGV